MTAKEITEQNRIIKKIAKKITASRKASREFLVTAGIHTKSGKLTKAYR